jgi:hypothetical protein
MFHQRIFSNYITKFHYSNNNKPHTIMITSQQRIGALAKWLTEQSVKLEGMPIEQSMRTSENLQPIVNEFSENIISVFIDNNVGRQDFLVLTLDEAATSSEIDGSKIFTDDDTTSFDGHQWIFDIL